jgi:hypothetical protein
LGEYEVWAFSGKIERMSNQHMEHLEAVLVRFAQAGLKLNLLKHLVFKEKVLYLRYMLSMEASTQAKKLEGPQ